MLQEIIASTEVPVKAPVADTPTKDPVTMPEIELSLIDTNLVSGEEVEIVKDIIGVDALSATAESLDILGAEALSTIETGGLSDQAVMVLMTGISSTLSITGTAPVELPAGESFGEEGRRVELTQLSGEGLKEKAAAVWKQIRAFLVRIGKSVSAFWAKQTDVVAKYNAKNKAAMEKYKSFAGVTETKEVKFPGVAAIMMDDKMATAAQIKADAKMVSETAKLLAQAAKQIKAIEGTAPGAIDSSIEDVVSKLGKEAPLADGKMYQMSEGYDKLLKGDELLGGDMLLIGIAKAESDKGTRGKFVSGKASKKAKEAMPILSIADATAMFSVSDEVLEAAKEAKEAGADLQDAMTAVLKKVDDAIKGDDEATAKAAQQSAKKVKDLQSLASDAAMGLYKHAGKVAAVCHNVGLTALKKYKVEKKTEDK